MKTIIGKIGLLAALVSTLPLSSSAAAPTIANGVARDLEHLTLLPGPTLTSPARGAPTAAPATTLLPLTPAEVGTFRFVPLKHPENSAVRRNGPGILTLRSSEEAPPRSASAQKPLPTPESLRFDSTLHSPGAASKVEFQPKL